MINTDLIKSIRDGFRLTPYQMAKKLGMDLKTYKTIEAGNTVNLKFLVKIAEEFKLPLTKLIQD
jgi:DNA-binding XRE family transcriptional regulator